MDTLWAIVCRSPLLTADDLLFDQPLPDCTSCSRELQGGTPRREICPEYADLCASYRLDSACCAVVYAVRGIVQELSSVDLTISKTAIRGCSLMNDGTMSTCHVVRLAETRVRSIKLRLMCTMTLLCVVHAVHH